MNHHLESLGWTLVHFCWQGGAIALLYWLADAALSKARSQTRYLLALAAMLVMLIAALATLGYEETRSEAALSWASGAVLPGASVVSGSSAPSPVVNTEAAAKQLAQLHLSSFFPWLDVVWLLGVACLSTRTIGAWRLIQQLRKKALVEAPEIVRADFALLCKRLGITRHVNLRISERIQGPLAMGIVRSLVLLPASTLMALSPEQLEAVLAHELAHVRRADYLWNLIQTMIETLFFFHPAVWWIGRRLRHQRELSCDDVAVQSCTDPLIYATALLRLEEQRSQRLNLAMALDGHRSWSGLGMRIARILGETMSEKGGPRELAPLPLAAICATLLLVLLPVPRLFAGLRDTWQIQTATPAGTPPALPAPTTLKAPAPAVSRVRRENSIASSVASAAPVSSLRAADANGAAEVRITDAPGVAGSALDVAVSGSGYGPESYGDSATAEQQAATGDRSAHKADYIDEMRAAGYDVDVDKYIAMKVQGITPEYAAGMAKAGFGKPSADDLIAMKVQGVTPEYVSELRAAGLQPSSIGDLVSYRIFHVTPEFLAAMKAAGFDSIPPKKLIELRVHGVTPEYAKSVKQQYPNATLDELVQLRIFHIDDAYIAAAKRHGFASLSIQKLVQLRISGVLGDDDAETK